jgi:ammonia channel protein AmtB
MGGRGERARMRLQTSNPLISGRPRSNNITFVLLKILSPLGLRVAAKEEEEGLDLAVHGEEGYRL